MLNWLDLTGVANRVKWRWASSGAWEGMRWSLSSSAPPLRSNQQLAIRPRKWTSASYQKVFNVCTIDQRNTNCPDLVGNKLTWPVRGTPIALLCNTILLLWRIKTDGWRFSALLWVEGGFAYFHGRSVRELGSWISDQWHISFADGSTTFCSRGACCDYSTWNRSFPHFFECWDFPKLEFFITRCFYRYAFLFCFLVELGEENEGHTSPRLTTWKASLLAFLNGHQLFDGLHCCCSQTVWRCLFTHLLFLQMRLPPLLTQKAAVHDNEQVHWILVVGYLSSLPTLSLRFCLQLSSFLSLEMSTQKRLCKYWW